MRIYCDTSALLKRALEEPESSALEAALARHALQNAVIASSSLTWIEVNRALLRSPLNGLSVTEGQIHEAAERALSGVAERPITEEVVSVARRVAPVQLRTLDAIHLATAILLEADEVVVYDQRLFEACRHHGLTVVTPGR